jgi:transcriptional regulator with XRE-family HTH domain
MGMKVDPSFIKAQRARRAWSQEHLAEVTGLGLRTIQRIEKTGTASYESARSLAAVFGVGLAHLDDERAASGPRLSVPLRPLLGTIAALVAGAALFVAANSFADQVLMDVSVMLRTSDETREGIDTSEWITQMIVDDGTLVPNVNDLRLQELRFTIVPKLLANDRILIEMQIFECQGEGEVLVSAPRHVVADGQKVEVVTGNDARSFRFSVAPRRQPRPLL